MSYRRGFKKWAEEQATSLRQAVGLTMHAALPAARLAKHLQIPIIKPQHIPRMSEAHLRCLLQLDPDGWSAITIMPAECVLIICNPAHSAARHESDVMHELAHVICKHPPARIIKTAGLSLRTYDPAVEDEAAWFGGCLQVPREGLLWALQDGLSGPNLEAHFGASSRLIRYRRQVTGVDLQLARARAQVITYRRKSA